MFHGGIMEAVENFALLIRGRRVTAKEREPIAVVNPATEAPIGDIPKATMADVDQAAEAAASAFERWRKTTPAERSALLLKAADLFRKHKAEIARNLTLEQGKVLAEAEVEVESTISYCEWFAGEALRAYGRVVANPGDSAMTHLIVKEPIGPCAVFTPWNFPLTEPAIHITAAIAAGCSVVLKPSEETPGTGVALARVFQEAGAPEGLVNVVTGVPAEISERLIRNPLVRKVSFTGSVAVGKQLAALAGAEMKPCTMELGGNAPFIVCDDADMERAVSDLTYAKWRNAGQVCTAPNRVFADNRVHDSLVERMTMAAKAIIVGDGLDSKSRMGPLANPRRLEALERLIADARRRGAEIVTGGERISNRGYFFAPTVIIGGGDNFELATNEIFGPVLSILRFEDLEDAIARANAVPVGLSAYAYTRSDEKARRLMRGLRSGMVGINTVRTAPFSVPFGGVRDSGYGAVGGQEGLEQFFERKAIAHWAGVAG
jgi:succinate-semialdehyde dehydrogenase/glutarate-semialdehyde dehydrogenase